MRLSSVFAVGAVLAAGVLSAWAGVPQVPSSFTCQYVLLVQTPSGIFQHQAGKLAVDGTKQRIRNEANSLLVGDTISLAFYAYGVQYDYGKSQRCDKLPLKGRFEPPFQPPSNASYEGTNPCPSLENATCDLFVDGESMFYLLAGSTQPVFVQIKDAEGTVSKTTVSNFVPGEPASSLFNVPSFC